MADKTFNIEVYDNNSLTIKKGNKLGNIEFKHKFIEDCTAKILDEEKKIKKAVNNNMQKVKKKLLKFFILNNIMAKEKYE